MRSTGRPHSCWTIYRTIVWKKKSRKHGIGFHCKNKSSGFYSVGRGHPVKVFQLGNNLGKVVLQLYNLKVEVTERGRVILIVWVKENKDLK